jgi:hypothetical protein
MEFQSQAYDLEVSFVQLDLQRKRGIIFRSTILPFLINAYWKAGIA